MGFWEEGRGMGGDTWGYRGGWGQHRPEELRPCPGKRLCLGLYPEEAETETPCHVGAGLTTEPAGQGVTARDVPGLGQVQSGPVAWGTWGEHCRVEAVGVRSTVQDSLSQGSGATAKSKV